MKLYIILSVIFLLSSARRKSGGSSKQQTRNQIRNAIKIKGPNCNFTSPSGEFTIASFGSGGILGLYRNTNNKTKKVVLIGPSGLGEYDANNMRVRGLNAFDRAGLSAQWSCGAANFTDIAANGSEVVVLGAQATAVITKNIMKGSTVVRQITITMTAAVLETTTYATVCRPRDPANCTVVELPFGLKFSVAIDNWKFAAPSNFLKFKAKATLPGIVRNIRRRKRNETTYGSRKRRRVIAASILAFDQGEINNPTTAMYGCNATVGGEVSVTVSSSPSRANLDLTYTFGAYPSDCLLEYDPVINDNGAATAGAQTTAAPSPTTTTSAATSVWLGMPLAIAGIFVSMFW